MNKAWVHYVKGAEERALGYLLKYTLLTNLNADYDEQSDEFIIYSSHDAEMYADHYLEMVKQTGKELLRYRALIPRFGSIHNDDDIKNLDLVRKDDGQQRLPDGTPFTPHGPE